MYTDHQKTDFVCVAASIISGGRNNDFELYEDGTKVTVNYAWPGAMYRSKEIFTEAIANKEVSLEHPKIH